MKRLVTTMLLLAGATVGYGQGTINWSDYQAAFLAQGLPAFSISVFSPGPGGIEQNMGNAPSSFNGDQPGGTAVYAGQLIGSGSGSFSGPTGYGNGSDYDIGLYAGSSQAATQAAVQTGTAAGLANFAVGYGGWDYSGNLLLTVNSFEPQSRVFIELAAWYNGGATGVGTGSITSYAAAVAAGVPAGTSVVSGSPVQASAYSSVTGGEVELGGSLPPSDGKPPAVSGTLAGLGITDFSLAASSAYSSTSATPEPSTIALVLIGASALFVRLRLKLNSKFPR